MMSILSSYLSSSKEANIETTTTNDDDTDGLVIHKNNPSVSSSDNKNDNTVKESCQEDKNNFASKTSDSEQVEEQDSVKDQQSPISNDNDEDSKSEHLEDTSEENEDVDDNVNPEDEEYEYLYVVCRNRTPVAYIDDEEHLQDYISDIKTRILREHKQLYNLKYVWSEVLKYDLERYCVVRLTLSSVNINSIIFYYNVDDTVDVYRVQKLCRNFK